MSEPIEISPQISAWMHRNWEMSRSTSDEMVNHLWSFAEDGQAILYFVLEAQVIWESATPRWHELPFGRIAPDNYDPPGTGPTYQRPQVRREYGLCVPVAPLSHSDVGGSRASILKSIERAQVLADALSFVTYEPVRLRAARRIETHWGLSSPSMFDKPQPPEGRAACLVPLTTVQENTATNIDDALVDERLRPFLVLLAAIPDADVQRTLERALNWHAQANLLQGLGRYVHYWASIELLGSFFYDYLRPEIVGRLTPSEREAALLRKVLDINSRNYEKTLNECHQIMSPTSRQKILSLAKIVLPERSDFRHVLFDKLRDDNGSPLAGAKSMYDIRNDIAHGNVSELLRTYLETHADRLQRFRLTSGEFIVAVLNNAQRLCQHRRPDFNAGDADVEPSE